MRRLRTYSIWAAPTYSIIDHIIMELAKYGLRTILVSNAVPKSSILKHCNIVLFKINPDFLEEGVAFSRNLINKLSEISTEEALVITSKGITKVRPLKAVIEPTHVIVRRFNDIRDAQSQEVASSLSNNGFNERLSDKVNGNEAKTVNTKVSEDLNSRDEEDGRAPMKQVNPVNDTVLINGSVINNGDSIFRKQIMELEREVANLRDKINEIERILDADEKLIEKILELDGKLKNNLHV